MTPFHPTLPFTPPTREVGFWRVRRPRTHKARRWGTEERSLLASGAPTLTSWGQSAGHGGGACRVAIGVCCLVSNRAAGDAPGTPLTLTARRVHLYTPTTAPLSAKPLERLVGATGIEPVTPPV
jgi:hypothetical protein